MVAGKKWDLQERNLGFGGLAVLVTADERGLLPFALTQTWL